MKKTTDNNTTTQLRICRIAGRLFSPHAAGQLQTDRERIDMGCFLQGPRKITGFPLISLCNSPHKFTPPKTCFHLLKNMFYLFPGSLLDIFSLVSGGRKANGSTQYVSYPTWKPWLKPLLVAMRRIVFIAGFLCEMGFLHPQYLGSCRQ